MSRTHIILRNIASNWLGFAVQALVVFFLTPYVLRTLGDTRYGVWILIISISGSYGLLALGFQSGVNQFLTRYLAKNDFEQMNRAASTATLVLSFVGLVIFAVAANMAWLAPTLFNIPVTLHSEVFWCIVIVGFSVLVQMSLFVFSATLMATQRFDLANIIGIVTRLLSAGLIVVALKLGWGLVGVSLATALSNTLEFCAKWCVAHRILPQLNVRPQLATWDAFHEMFSFGTWSFLITIAQTIFTYVDSLVIGAILPIAALAPYALAAGLIRQLESLLIPVELVLFPAVTQLHARNELDTLRRVYLRGSRIFFVIVGIVSVLAGFWAKDFFRIWVGNQYVSGQTFTSVALLFYVLLIAMCGRLFPGIGGQVLMGSMRIKPLALVAFVEAIANAILSVILIRFYGLMGVAVGTLVSVLIFRSFAIPLLLRNQLNVPLLTYVHQTALRPLVVAAALSLVAMSIRQLGQAESFLTLFAQGTAAAIFAIPLAMFIGLTRNDREQFIYRPIMAIMARVAGYKSNTADL